MVIYWIRYRNYFFPFFEGETKVFRVNSGRSQAIKVLKLFPLMGREGNKDHLRLIEWQSQIKKNDYFKFIRMEMFTIYGSNLRQ